MPQPSDLVAQRVMSESLTWRALERALALATTAWQHSAARTLLIPLPGISSRSDRIPYVAIAVAAASLTALALRTAMSRPEPLTWIVPVLGLVVAGLILAAGWRGPSQVR
jgi:hypothetical protein